jgi:hypothetical protein
MGKIHNSISPLDFCLASGKAVWESVEEKGINDN